MILELSLGSLVKGNSDKREIADQGSQAHSSQSGHMFTCFILSLIPH